MDVAKAKRDFQRSRKLRPVALILGLIEVVFAVVFGMALLLSIKPVGEFQFSDTTTLSEIYHYSVSTSLVLCGLAMGMTATGMLAIHSIFQGLFENPRDRLLAHLLDNIEPGEDSGNQPLGN